MKWSLEDLSRRSGISTATLKRFEFAVHVPNGHLSTFNTLKKIYEEEGIEFIGSPDSQAGVRWKE